MRNDKSISRRKFLGVAAGATGAAAVGPWAPGALADRGRGRRGGDRLLPKDRLAVQLFTLRNRISTLGFGPVFQELAAIGYKWVEFAGYGAPDTNIPNPNPPPTNIPDVAKLRSLLRQNRLRGIGSHIGVTQFRDNLEQVLDDAETLGLRYIGTASEPDQLFPTAERQSVDAYRRAAEAYNAFGAAAKARGMRFYHHNHSSEFAVVDGIRLYDVLMEETDPKLVFFQLDIFWAYVGATGAPAVTTPTGSKSWFPNFDPTELVWDQPERFPLFHAKDGVRTEVGSPTTFGWQFVDPGDGNVPLWSLFNGLETDEHFYIVERDNHNFPGPAPPAGEPRNNAQLETARRGFEYLAGLRERHFGDDDRRGDDDDD
jgi:sugar phosphate isomerase/epimerase